MNALSLRSHLAVQGIRKHVGPAAVSFETFPGGGELGRFGADHFLLFGMDSGSQAGRSPNQRGGSDSMTAQLWHPPSGFRGDIEIRQHDGISKRLESEYRRRALAKSHTQIVSREYRCVA